MHGGSLPTTLRGSRRRFVSMCPSLDFGSKLSIHPNTFKTGEIPSATAWAAPLDSGLTRQFSAWPASTASTPIWSASRPR